MLFLLLLNLGLSDSAGFVGRLIGPPKIFTSSGTYTPTPGTKKILIEVYDALVEKGGYDPINQIVGYILSEDPGYITNYKNARTLIRKIDRDELLQALIKNYLEN